MTAARRTRMGQVIRVVVFAAGVILLFLPVVSVWRLSGQALANTPADIGSSSVDDRHRLALFDRDFVLGERIYRDATPDTVVTALRTAGFEGVPNAPNTLALDCCGSYDGVTVTLKAEGPTDTRAQISAIDDDIVIAWPFISMLGAALMVVAAIATVISTRQRPHPLTTSQTTVRKSVSEAV